MVTTGTFIGSLCGNAVAIIKAIKSGHEAQAARSEAGAIQAERKIQAALRDQQVQDLNTKYAVLDTRLNTHDKRMDEWRDSVKQLDSKIDDLRSAVDSKIDNLISDFHQLIMELRSKGK